MRIALIGASSFIARHVMEAAAQAGIGVMPLAHDADLDQALPGVDAAINFGLDPSFRTSAHDPARDCELKAAQAAARHDVRFVMLSTRRVYPPAHRWNARETALAEGDETAYGRNKSLTEAAVRATTQNQALILRLSNIIGFEYNPARVRGTFMAMLMRTLRGEGKIYYDMHPDTKRDFLTASLCARAILNAVSSGARGTYNLGSGFPITCAQLAEWTMEGFGGGSLIVTCNDVRDSFFLNMDKWRSQLPLSVTPDALRHEIVELGRRLRHA